MDVKTLNLTSLESVALSDRCDLPHISAVYLAITRQGDVLYVGQSVDIFSRWTNHNQLQPLLNRSGIRIAWLPCPIKELESLESECITRFNPTLNAKFERKSTSNRFEMRMPADTSSQIKRIRERFALKSDAGAIIFAVHALCLQFDLPISSNLPSNMPEIVIDAAVPTEKPVIIPPGLAICRACKAPIINEQCNCTVNELATGEFME